MGGERYKGHKAVVLTYREHASVKELLYVEDRVKVE